MDTNDHESLLQYYNDELTYLRRLGRSFARRYPKVAAQLEMSDEQCADPHVERLLESFAFLTARLQRRIDGEFPDITASLLSVMYPQLVDPVPPMAIALFEVDAKQGKITTGHKIPRDTPLFAQTSGGLTCRFRTCYPVTLWPLELASAGFESPNQFSFLDSSAKVASVLRLRLNVEGALLQELSLKTLRFFLRGDTTLVNTLYELIFGHVLQVAILPENAKRPVYLPANSVLPVGFGDDEDVIPYPPHALPAYRLIQEYFAFPEKFQFFEIDNLNLHQGGKTLDLLLILDRMPPERMTVDRRNFSLGCAPIINLFPKTTEPIRIDQRHHEYRLEPDMRRERTTEIHTILSVSASSNPLEETVQMEPFYSYRHRLDQHGHRAFWFSRRLPTGREDLPGTDIFLSFVDLDFNPRLPPNQVVYAHTLCTNRDFTAQMTAGAQLQIEDVAPLSQITCLGKPTLTRYPPMAGATLWYLISNLSLNYLSLSGGPESLEALRHILRVYSFSDQPSTFQQVQGLRKMECRRVSRRVGNEPWRGFCQGTEVTLTFDESLYVGSGAFLLGAVLNQFLSLYTSINSFTQLAIKSEQREGEWKRWAPLAGYQQLV
jgi:type VI secretion system protein ImpG